MDRNVKKMAPVDGEPIALDMVASEVVLSQLSLLLNIVVLVPVCASLLGEAAWITDAYGPPSPARSILLSIYLAILVISIGLSLRPEPSMVMALLSVQILYKVTTPFIVGTLKNPVVLSNLAIAAFHGVTVGSLWPQTSR